ncbi:MAG: serine/threonine-protein kinase [Myxococcota bacterium]
MSTQQQPFVPQSFGKYFLVDKIATGGMAEIFKAKTFSHGGFENLLVIKRILPHIGENQDFVGMFVDEARVSVALQHPNIVRVYDFGKILENYFIAMECVDGKDARNILKKLARRKDYLPEKYCAFIAHEVCKGLHYAHTKADLNGNPYGIVHRDISPSNVLVSYEGEVKVADFGIAKAEGNAYQTRDGMLKGKFEYMSPEQAQGKEIDFRSDLFSLGIILHEMLTGRRLFKTDSEIATLKKIRDGEIESPRKLKLELSERIEQICMKALAKDPADRYPSAQVMSDDLREFLFPETADTLRREFREYLHQLFAEEMAEERQRLESGNALAVQLRDRLSTMDWEHSPSEVTMSQVTQTAVQFVVPWIAAIGLGMLLLFGVALVVLLVGIAKYGPTMATNPQLPTQTVVAGPTGIDVIVFPEAKILLDGVEKGVASTLTLDGLAEGEHHVRLEAEGFVPVDETVKVEANKLVKVAKKLEPVPEPVAPKPVVAAPTPSKGVKRAAPVPDPAPAAAEPSRLSVMMVGGGWATVYVDGVKLGKSAPFKDVVVAGGAHEVRVENPQLGLALTERHTFGPGQTVTIRAKAP